MNGVNVKGGCISWIPDDSWKTHGKTPVFRDTLKGLVSTGRPLWNSVTDMDVLMDSDRAKGAEHGSIRAFWRERCARCTKRGPKWTGGGVQENGGGKAWELVHKSDMVG